MQLLAFHHTKYVASVFVGHPIFGEVIAKVSRNQGNGQEIQVSQWQCCIFQDVVALRGSRGAYLAES